MTIKSCKNCEFRVGFGTLSECWRAGGYCSHQMQFGGKCGIDLKFWVQRRPWWWRLIRRLIWGSL